MAALARARLEGHVGPLPAVAVVPFTCEMLADDEVAFDDLVVGAGLVAYVRIIPDIEHIEILVGGDPWPLRSSPLS